MPSDKAAYLAAHYLNADRKPSSSSTKKRKRKQPPTTSGLLITDDDETGWGSGSARAKDADEEDDVPLTVAGTTTDFRRTKKSTWKPIGAPPPAPKDDAADAAAADAIIASAAAESLAITADADEDANEPAAAPQMSNDTLAGLQSASALTAQLKRRQQLEAAELAELKAARDAAAKDQSQAENDPADEVILRDATGRRVDASLRRAEARRQAAEAERAARAKLDLLKGEVQSQEARARREKLQEAALLPLARGRDDAEMNAEMKRAGRWNDPMAEFLAAGGSTEPGGGGGGGGKGARRKGRMRPVYKGAAAPNRYGIRPGYRWDGVDRGNGIEAERFKALNRRERDKGLEYAWQMDE